MENVIRLNVPFRQTSRAARHAALMTTFAEGRRGSDDVFWLKENAELLNILECTGARPDQADLAVHDNFYDRIEQRLGFFPQYYRFLLSICLDIEDLGTRNATKGARLVQWVAEQGLAEAELSDLQRAEARRLCLRRGVDPLPHDAGLNDRLRGFARRSETFSMPNKKAAYELTHIVFYLSEYGRRDPGIDDAIRDSLIFAGTLAFLDFNVDLLAEICIALRYSGETPPEIWDDWLHQQLGCFSVITDEAAPLMDDYHEYLMLNWYMSLGNTAGFDGQIPEGRAIFRRARPQAGPLRELSECMYDLGAARSGDWEAMRGRVTTQLSDEAQAALAAAEAANAGFDRFFHGFARVGLAGSGLAGSALAGSTLAGAGA